MVTTTKKDICLEISSKKGVSRALTKDIINGFLEELKGQFQKGNRVELRGFGVFYPYFRKKRPYINPHTSSEDMMPDKTILKFKPSKHLFLN